MKTVWAVPHLHLPEIIPVELIKEGPATMLVRFPSGDEERLRKASNIFPSFVAAKRYLLQTHKVRVSTLTKKLKEANKVLETIQRLERPEVLNAA